jgi:hypothetical protein
MTSSPNPQQASDLSELRDRLKWLDEERRKASHKVAYLEQRLEQQGRELAERDKKIADLERQIAAQATHLSELENRIAPTSDVIATLTDEAMRTEASVKAWVSDQLELREMVTGMLVSVNRDQSELDQKLANWQATLDEQKDVVDQLSQQWISLSNQYKEARMAVQNFAIWQKQLEQQKRESGEIVRQEMNRLQSRWDAIVSELQERLREFEVDQTLKWQAFELAYDQRWAAYRRSEPAWREQLSILENLIHRVQLDSRNLILRVQAAQVDAIKRWPLLLSEEVEKAVEQNHSRPLITAAADPHSSLSVMDAIERGLITIDYESKPDAGS